MKIDENELYSIKSEIKQKSQLKSKNRQYKCFKKQAI